MKAQETSQFYRFPMVCIFSIFSHNLGSIVGTYWPSKNRPDIEKTDNLIGDLVQSGQEKAKMTSEIAAMLDELMGRGRNEEAGKQSSRSKP